LPIKHKCITAQPLIEEIDIEKYLDNTELVVVGGECDINARPLDYDWVLKIREQCISKDVSFEFRQCGTYFLKEKNVPLFFLCIKTLIFHGLECIIANRMDFILIG